jgi:serine/threonine-protein kinase RsbW
MAIDLKIDASGSEHPPSMHFDVTLPADVAAISPVVGWVMRLVGELEDAEGKEFEIEMALREALANAIVHGCKADPAKMVEFSVTGDREQGVMIVVRDPGSGFDPASIPSPDDDSNLHSDHGRGIFLITKLMDEVTHEQNGTVIRMRKFLTAMPANPVARAPEPPPDKPVENPVENKVYRFRPEMPTIPGVSQASPEAACRPSGMDSQLLLQIGGAAAAVVLIGALIFWRVKPRPAGETKSSPDSDAAAQAAPTPDLPAPAPAVQEIPNVAATVEELSKPWDAKKFTFANPLTQENIDAMVIRLPGGELWAFSLKGPFGRCELEYVTNLGRLATEFKFNATHPMVVSQCDSTVYDPLKVGPLGGNTWARGEIVQGSSLRPPISIDVKVSGRSIIADGIE